MENKVVKRMAAVCLVAAAGFISSCSENVLGDIFKTAAGGLTISGLTLTEGKALAVFAVSGEAIAGLSNLNPANQKGAGIVLTGESVVWSDVPAAGTYNIVVREIDTSSPPALASLKSMNGVKAASGVKLDSHGKGTVKWTAFQTLAAPEIEVSQTLDDETEGLGLETSQEQGAE
ncbi:MAG: hypothetical protein LBC77_04895 [Spirochaetaceae bacterium]|jgi:hypothetical protein|nr:hypothetical protein [Spirochaetaceae bacterium]